MGGTDDPSNLLKVNTALHAFLHKCLYEEHGRWEDKVAWKCLSGQVKGAEVNHLINVERGKSRVGPKNPQYGKPGPFAGKKRPEISERMKDQSHRRKLYEITSPDGTKQIVKGLVKFCKENNINASNLCQVANGKKQHANGYTCKRIEE